MPQVVNANDNQRVHEQTRNIGDNNKLKPKHSKHFFELDAWREQHPELNDGFQLTADVWQEILRNPDEMESILDRFIKQEAETEDPWLIYNRVFSDGDYIQKGPNAQKAAPGLYKDILNELVRAVRAFLPNQGNPQETQAA